MIVFWLNWVCRRSLLKSEDVSPILHQRKWWQSLHHQGPFLGWFILMFQLSLIFSSFRCKIYVAYCSSMLIIILQLDSRNSLLDCHKWELRRIRSQIVFHILVGFMQFTLLLILWIFGDLYIQVLWGSCTSNCYNCCILCKLVWDSVIPLNDDCATALNNLLKTFLVTSLFFFHDWVCYLYPSHDFPWYGVYLNASIDNFELLSVQKESPLGLATESAHPGNFRNLFYVCPSFSIPILAFSPWSCASVGFQVHGCCTKSRVLM